MINGYWNKTRSYVGTWNLKYFHCVLGMKDPPEDKQLIYSICLGYYQRLAISIIIDFH